MEDLFWFQPSPAHVMADCAWMVSLQLCEIIEPGGKNHAGYWQEDTDILKQLEQKAIPAFNLMHPKAGGLFVFDNSTTMECMQLMLLWLQRQRRIWDLDEERIP